MPEFTGHRDMRSYIRTIWRWKLLILVLVVGAPAVAYFIERGKQKQYTSSVLVSVQEESVNSALLSGNASFSTTNIQAIARLITTPSIADIAGSELTPSQSGSQVVSGVSASANPTTNYITITATKPDPNEAADVANAFAKALGKSQQQQAVDQIKQAIASTKAELSHIKPSNPNYPSLETDLSNYNAALGDQGGNATILDPATPNLTPIGPHPKRAAELGLVIGILLAFGAVMLLDSADRRLRSPDDLEEFTKLPLLAAIAPSAFDAELDTTPVDAEAFQTLRTSLTYFTIDEKIKSVLVASPGEQEGKSTVTVRLALACARAGLDVVLIDADLRRAGSTTKLGLQPKIGLGVVLAEQRPVETALIDWPLGPDEPGRLRVLAAGSPPPNPAALISSQQMRNVIHTLEDQADLVIIDTPAALAVSDAVPLMQNVSGVVLVARMNRSSRDTVRRLQKIIESAHGRLLGTVATGVTAGPGYEKYSQAYYSPTRGAGGSRRQRRRAKKAAGSSDDDRGVKLAQPQELPETHLVD
jgi:capsular exopolysaccharide synthesis family protein